MKENKKGWVRITRWVARIWSLVPITYTLAEILFPHGQQGVEVPLADWINLGFIFASVVGLAIAWRWERLGGWLSLVTLAVFTVMFLVTVERSFPMVLIFLVGVGVPAVLFLVSSYAER
jgi:uncharacterized membrane protein HdeD (DUF308 family)